MLNNYIGEIAGLSAAFLWAVASIVYSRLGLKIPPLQLNFYKGVIAIAFIVLTLAIQQASWGDISLKTIILLAISGIIGIGLGDTAYFFALNIIGARHTLLLETSSPPMGAILALIFIGEQLSFYAWCGISLTIAGILWVISEGNPDNSASISISKIGILWAMLAAIAQASGAVISRFALINSAISPLQSTLIRLLGGVSIVLGLLIFKSPWRQQQPQINWQLSPQLLFKIAIAAFGSTYLGIWLQQTSLKFAPTGIAQTLLATSPLFVIPLVVMMGEVVTMRACFGVVIAVTGISLLFL